jgi:hypothetical protein
MRVFKSKFFLSLILFSITFIFFAQAGRDIWFSLDDLGNIINGLIQGISDFFRVFSQDERAYIYPANFTIPKANVISGFYRPLQHIPFTLIYKYFGFYAFAYYLTSVAFHALNTVLIFYLFSYYMPLIFAFLSGLVFAFGPILDWITWISCLHNFMALFFMLLALLFFRLFCISSKLRWQFLAALMFLFSIISRENTIMLGLWLFCGVFLLTPSGFWQRLKFAIKQTWMFFVVYFSYFLLRLNAFGLSSLDRTFNNLILKYPVLRNFLGVQVQVAGTYGPTCSQIPHAENCLHKPLVVSLSNHLSGWGESLLNKLAALKSVFSQWGMGLLNINFDNVLIFLLGCCLIIFIIWAYRKNLMLFFTLCLGFLFFIWPGIVAYPSPRYISAAYPFLIFIFFMAVYLISQRIERTSLRTLLFLIITLASVAYVCNGINKNFSGIKSICQETRRYRQKFADFFEKHKFDPDVNFIVMGSPFASDIQNVFQAFLSNLDLKLAFVRESCIAQRGTMGCNADYRTVGVRSKIERIGKNGFRFISLDKDHCCWWMNYSHFPLKWSEGDRAYVWSADHPQVGKWYDFSMGKFIINDRVGQHFVTDVTFLIDDVWIDDKTVFVVWDSHLGRYERLS